MSMENELKRIADALEALVATMANPIVCEGVEVKTPGKKTAKKAVDAPAAKVEEPAPSPEPEEDPFGSGVLAKESSIELPQLDGPGLRDLAQKLMQGVATDEGKQKMIAFIKNDVCLPLSPKDPKLVKIPAAKIPEAAGLLFRYAKDNGIPIREV